MSGVSIRSYERKDLPCNQRLTSLAKRFPSLKNARGVSPFSEEELHNFTLSCDSEAAKQAGLMLLSLAEYHGASEKFNFFVAMKVWSEADRQMFVNVLRIWDF